MWNKLDNNFSLASFLFHVDWCLSILYSSFFCVPFVFQFKFFLFSCMQASPNFFHLLMFCLFVHELDILLVCRSSSCQLCYSPFSPSFLSTHCMISYLFTSNHNADRPGKLFVIPFLIPNLGPFVFLSQLPFQLLNIN